MQYVSEYRDHDRVQAVCRRIASAVTRPWRIMEVCGGQTHAIVRHGLDQLLPSSIELIHGPGCPVCVTPDTAIDAALGIASQAAVTLCSYGDMLRVPGSAGRSLIDARAHGADVRVVQDPLESVRLAQDNPQREVVFLAVGFETTAPANAMAVDIAQRLNLQNYTVLVSHVLVPPAMEMILSQPDRSVDGFLAAGHVCTVMGFEPYEAIAHRYRVPIVVTGFEPLDIVEGIELCVNQLECGRAAVENQYVRSVTRTGNRVAQDLVERVFEVVDYPWRGIGEIPASGLALRAAYHRLDARRRFPIDVAPARTDTGCQSGAVLTGRIKPSQCPHFGKACTPRQPMGAPMVSSEGACAAYYHFRPESI
jgi:hydrogenase expression/formation protein HypD